MCGKTKICQRNQLRVLNADISIILWSITNKLKMHIIMHNLYNSGGHRVGKLEWQHISAIPETVCRICRESDRILHKQSADFVIIVYYYYYYLNVVRR